MRPAVSAVTQRRGWPRSALISPRLPFMVPATMAHLSLLPGRARLLLLLALATVAGALAVPAARAQDSMRIAAVVNEDAISVLDVGERADLIFATTGLTDNAETRQRIMPQIVRTLIDESLQIQEAERQGIDIEAIDLGFAYRLVEQNLGLPDGQLTEFLSYHNLSQETVDRQLTAEIVWNELVQRRMRDDEISQQDIDEELLRIEQTANEPAYLLAEIFVAVDEPEREAEQEANLRRLGEAIAQGASFPQLARQFSQSASAAEGGDLGWIAESQLSEELREVVPAMEPGTMSPPLRVIGGFVLILLREKRQGLEIDPMDASISMRQAIVPILAGESTEAREARAREIAATLETCADFDGLSATGPDLLVSAPITVRLSELQPRFLEPLRELPPDELAPPIASDQGIHLVMICERMEPESPLPTAEDVRMDLENQQFDLIARGFLRDLRRAAFVDVRL